MLLALSMPLRALARRCQSWRMRSRSAQRGQRVEVEILAVHEGHAQAFQLPRLQGASLPSKARAGMSRALSQA